MCYGSISQSKKIVDNLTQIVDNIVDIVDK